MNHFVTVEREIHGYYTCNRAQYGGGVDGCLSFIPADKDGKPPGVYCQCGCAMSYHRKGVAKIKEQIEISKAKVIYGACQKNHAVASGGSGCRLDGCVEFKPAGLATNEDAMVCAACNCHVSFHLRQYVSPK